jgi:hypothetical protein
MHENQRKSVHHVFDPAVIFVTLTSFFEDNVRMIHTLDSTRTQVCYICPFAELKRNPSDMKLRALPQTRIKSSHEFNPVWHQPWPSISSKTMQFLGFFLVRRGLIIKTNGNLSNNWTSKLYLFALLTNTS